MKRSSPPPKRVRWADLPGMHPHAAGLAIGARAIGVAVPPDRAAEPVRVVETFTPDLHALGDGLIQGGIDTVAMASTGGYGVPVVELLEQGGLQPYLVNARSVKTVPGRKSDGNAAQWLLRPGLGLLHAAFRPDAARRILRPLLRQRAQLLAHRAPHSRHRPKALKRMNIQLSAGLTDITGVTGPALWRAVVHGERAPLPLAQLRNPACKSSADDLAPARTGPWRDEQGCILPPARALGDCATHQRAECEARVEPQFAAMQPRFERLAPSRPLPRGKPGSKSQTQPRDAARAHLARLTGVDRVAVTGISASLAQTILAEVGTDMSPFPPVKHFCSWLGLAPHHNVSGGNVWRSRTLTVVSRATQALRPAAQAGARSGASFGADCRAMRARLGPPQAPVAPAPKIARVVYHLLKHREPFTGESAAADEHQRRERALTHLTRRASQLGYVLTPVAISPPAAPV